MGVSEGVSDMVREAREDVTPGGQDVAVAVCMDSASLGPARAASFPATPSGRFVSLHNKVYIEARIMRRGNDHDARLPGGAAARWCDD